MILLIVMTFFATANAADDPIPVAKEFMRALYSNDRAAYERVIVPHPKSSMLLGQTALSSKELMEIAAATSRMRFEKVQDFTHGAQRRVRYTTEFRGTPMIVTMVRNEGAWKVDIRWWIAMAEQAQREEPQRGTPEFAAKALLSALATGEFEDAKGFVVPNADTTILFRGAPAHPEPSDQLVALALEMPLVETAPGEFFALPSGQIVEGTKAPDTKLLVGLFGPNEIAFLERKVGEEWRVVPQPYFSIINR